MAPNELRALADTLHDASASLNGTHFVAARKSAAYLRTQADAQPVAWSDGLGSFIAADERVGDDPDILAYRVPLYTHPAPAAPAVAERGPWTADQRGRHVWVDSDDLTHDVRLVVNGDFESDDQKFAYAQEIARRLNAAPAASQAEPKREPLSDAIVTVVNELAALIPKPDQPTVDDWPCDNPADRQALQIAYTTARDARDGIGGSDAE